MSENKPNAKSFSAGIFLGAAFVAAARMVHNVFRRGDHHDSVPAPRPHTPEVVREVSKVKITAVPANASVIVQRPPTLREQLYRDNFGCVATIMSITLRQKNESYSSRQIEERTADLIRKSFDLAIEECGTGIISVDLLRTNAQRNIDRELEKMTAKWNMPPPAAMN